MKAGSVFPAHNSNSGVKPEKPVDTIMQAGQIVDGKYRVDHLLGQGGMAAVWAGTNERTGKRVALKVILRSFSTTHEAEHLVYSEALAASRVNHPNVVTVFDVIEHEGMACIVMELLDGEPLGTYIARHGYLSVSEATSLLIPAMRGVAAANSLGVVHRDLKPQNIFICIGPDGRVVTTKVLDFGISVMMERVVDRSAGPVPALAMGTPAYMSPEHISGETRIDERADVYGFGLLLYEALTGRMAFPGEPGPELFSRVLKETAPPVTLFRPDLPAGLVRIIGVAMAKEPDHRYSDLNLMVSALEDELRPPNSVPRTLTPLAGVPSFVLGDAKSGQSLVQAILKMEPSGQHQETKMLFAFPLGKEKEKSATNGGSNRESNDSSEEKRPLPATGRETVQLRPGPPLETGSLPATGRETILLHPLRNALLRLKSVTSLRARLLLALRPRSRAAFRAKALSVLRSRRGLVGAGVAVALVFAVWMATRGAHHAQRATPPVADTTPGAGTLAAPPTVPAFVPTAIVVPQAPPAPLATSPSPPAPGTLARAAHNKPTSHARATPVGPAAPSGSRVALPDSSSDRPAGHQAVRGALRGPGPAQARSPAPRDEASAKSAAPRAGKLSADDF